MIVDERDFWIAILLMVVLFGLAWLNDLLR